MDLMSEILRDVTLDKSFYELENEKIMSCPCLPLESKALWGKGCFSRD